MKEIDDQRRRDLAQIANKVAVHLNEFGLTLSESLIVLTSIIGQPAAEVDNLDNFCADIERQIRAFASVGNGPDQFTDADAPRAMSSFPWRVRFVDDAPAIDAWLHSEIGEHHCFRLSDGDWLLFVTTGSDARKFAATWGGTVSQRGAEPSTNDRKV